MTKDPLNGKELTLNRRSSDFRNGTIITTKILSYGMRILISSLNRLSRRSRWRAHDLCACDSTANREVGGQKNEKREQRRDLCLKNLRPSGESLDEGAAPLLGEQGRVVHVGVVGEPGPLDEGEDDGVLLPNQRVPHPSQRQILRRWRLLLLVHLAATEEREQRVKKKKKKKGRRGGGGARKKMSSFERKWGDLVAAVECSVEAISACRRSRSGFLGSEGERCCDCGKQTLDPSLL